MKKKIERLGSFLTWKIDFESQNFAIFDNFCSRLTDFLGGWLLVCGIKEGMVECATVCVKSVVILNVFLHGMSFSSSDIVSYPRTE